MWEVVYRNSDLIYNNDIYWNALSNGSLYLSFYGIDLQEQKRKLCHSADAKRDCGGV